jgi:hypothetical protein
MYVCLNIEVGDRRSRTGELNEKRCIRRSRGWGHLADGSSAGSGPSFVCR